MGLGVGGPLRVEPACLRHEGRRLPEPDGRASQAADTIDSAARGEPLAHCGGSTMAVPTDKARGPGPGPPPHGEATHQAQRLCSPRRACAWAPTGGPKAGEVPRKRRAAQSHHAGRRGERNAHALLALGRGISMSEVEHPGGGRLGGAGEARGDQGVGKSGEVLAVDAVVKPGKGGGHSPGPARVPGAAAPRGAATRGRPGDAWHHCRPHTRRQCDRYARPEVTERVVDRGRRPLGLHRRGKACGEAHLAIDTTQPEGATVGRQGSAFASRSHGSASDRRKTPLCWSRMSPERTSWGLYGMVVSHLPFYQRLTRGLCFFVKNPG